MKTHKIPYGTPEWHAFRQRGIGGSEVGSVMGLSPFRCSLELFHQKLGLAPEAVTNEAMLFGQLLEDKVAEAWSYFDGTESGWVTRAASKNPFRTCRKKTGYVTNDRYPWLFFSPDRIIQSGQIGWKRGEHGAERFEIGNPGAYLECKCVNDHHFQHDPVQLAHCAQVQTGMMMMGMEYGELAMLVGGNRLEVKPIEVNLEFQEQIIDETAEFWGKIEQARHVLVSAFARGLNRDEEIQAVEHLAPEPKDSEAEAYAKYVGIAYAPVDSDVMANGSDWDLMQARDYQRHLEAEKAATAAKKRIGADLKRKIIGMGVQGLSFGHAGKVTYKENINGEYRINVNVK